MFKGYLLDTYSGTYSGYIIIKCVLDIKGKNSDILLRWNPDCEILKCSPLQIPVMGTYSKVWCEEKGQHHEKVRYEETGQHHEKYVNCGVFLRGCLC